MATGFSELSESDFGYSKTIFKERRQLELLLMYLGNIQKERNSVKSKVKQVSELLRVKLLI